MILNQNRGDPAAAVHHRRFDKTQSRRGGVAANAARGFLVRLNSVAARTRRLPMPRHFAMTVNAPVTIIAARRF